MSTGFWRFVAYLLFGVMTAFAFTAAEAFWNGLRAESLYLSVWLMGITGLWLLVLEQVKQGERCRWYWKDGFRDRRCELPRGHTGDHEWE